MTPLSVMDSGKQVKSAVLALTSKGKEIALIFREKLGSDVYLPASFD